MELSRSSTLNIIEQSLPIQYHASLAKCYCYHCINDTKPCTRLKPTRITSQRENTLSSCQAYDFVLKKLAAFQFSGRVLTPEVFFVRDATLVSSAKGRIRLKQNQSHIDIKKHFQEHRRKILQFNPLLQSNSLLQTNSLLAMSIQMSGVVNSSKVSKEIALLCYDDGGQQILSESMFNKILSKRRNDSSWDQISHVILIPPEGQSLIQKVSYHYERNSDTITIIMPIMQRISQEIDSVEEGTAKREPRFSGEESLPALEVRSITQSSMHKPISRSNSSSNKRNVSSGISSFFDVPSKEEVERATLEIVAFIQLTCQLRLLKASFEYFTASGRLYLANIKLCICEQLVQQQLSLVHDRYKPLEEVKVEQIMVQKRAYDDQEQQLMWKICAEVVSECLDMRKIQLKLQSYKKPNEQTLVKIFLRLFPEFKVEQIFSSATWKKQIHDFFQDKKRTIHKIIREDEGIRILRRFGINFKRTFE